MIPTDSRTDIVVPTFLIGGAPKAGTTSLYHYLDQHPDVCMSARKETGVFMENYDKGVEWSGVAVRQLLSSLR